jgi:FKBP-type peptidyl-prolyl cis-trans isomerase FklB
MSGKKLTGELEKFSYALGMSVGSNLIKSGVKKINPEHFINALNDSFTGEIPKLQPNEANEILEKFVKENNKDQSSDNLKKGLEFLKENKNRTGVIELPSGLQYEIIQQGDGELASIENKVKCHYQGTLIDGTVFDSSVKRGQPAEFPVNAVIPGWVEALQLMPQGSKWKLYIPPELGYGERGAGEIIKPNSTLIFEIELLEIL